MPPVAILAGGLATRLRPLTESVPKSLVEVAGEPFIFHQLALLQTHGMQRVVVCLGAMGEQIQCAIGNGSRWELHISYSADGAAPLGTGGAIRAARPQLGKEFFVMYGDSYLRCDFAAIEAAFRSAKKTALMTVLRNDNRWDQSNVLFRPGLGRDGELLRYDKQAPSDDMRHIDFGLGLFSAAAFDGYPEGEPLDLARVYTDLCQRGELAGYEVQDRFYEIGSPRGLAETREFLERQT
ncbi:MAG: sugar phosphate nucleotidyltransferase [Acidobacteriaceae bacterium]